MLQLRCALNPIAFKFWYAWRYPQLSVFHERGHTPKYSRRMLRMFRIVGMLSKCSVFTKNILFEMNNLTYTRRTTLNKTENHGIAEQLTEISISKPACLIRQWRKLKRISHKIIQDVLQCSATQSEQRCPQVEWINGFVKVALLQSQLNAQTRALRMHLDFEFKSTLKVNDFFLIIYTNIYGEVRLIEDCSVRKANLGRSNLRPHNFSSYTWRDISNWSSC